MNTTTKHPFKDNPGNAAQLRKGVQKYINSFPRQKIDTSVFQKSPEEIKLLKDLKKQYKSSQS